MSSFTKPLDTRYIGNGLRKVLTPFIFWSEDVDKGVPIYIPDGYATDFASVPFFARGFIPKDGNYNQAAVVHDYLYNNTGKVFDRNEEIKIKEVEVRKGFLLRKTKIQVLSGKVIHAYTRAEVDRLFLLMMEVIDSQTDMKIPKWKRITMFSAVRAGGWKGWNRAKKFNEKYS